MVWAQILQWLCSKETGEPLRYACAQALGALAADSGPAGQEVARAWLGDLLIYLTLDAKTHQSIKEVCSRSHAMLMLQCWIV
jgi:hypothetical protein